MRSKSRPAGEFDEWGPLRILLAVSWPLGLLLLGGVDLLSIAPGITVGLGAFITWMIGRRLWHRRQTRRLEAEEFFGDEEIARLVAKHERRP